MFHEKASGNVLNVFVCLTEESFTRYTSALYGCGFQTKPAAVGFAETVGLDLKMVEVRCFGCLLFSLHFIYLCVNLFWETDSRDVK